MFWSHHEITEKWTELRCEFCPREPFKYVDDLKAHLVKTHEEEFKDSIELSRIIDDARQAIPKIKLSACPFCDPSDKDGDAAVDKRVFVAHVGRHMEELAFYSLNPALC